MNEQSHKPIQVEDEIRNEWKVPGKASKYFRCSTRMVNGTQRVLMNGTPLIEGKDYILDSDRQGYTITEEALERYGLPHKESLFRRICRAIQRIFI